MKKSLHEATTEVCERISPIPPRITVLGDEERDQILMMDGYVGVYLGRKSIDDEVHIKLAHTALWCLQQIRNPKFKWLQGVTFLEIAVGAAVASVGILTAYSAISRGEAWWGYMAGAAIGFFLLWQGRKHMISGV